MAQQIDHTKMLREQLRCCLQCEEEIALRMRRTSLCEEQIEASSGKEQQVLDNIQALIVFSWVAIIIEVIIVSASRSQQRRRSRSKDCCRLGCMPRYRSLLFALVKDLGVVLGRFGS